MFVKLKTNKVKTNLGNHKNTLNINFVNRLSPINENNQVTKNSSLPFFTSVFTIP